MIVISVDCEQWNLASIRGRIDLADNNTDYSSEGNKRLLEILERNKVLATFFITGFFAEKEKEQVKLINDKGHEIACHGYNHFYRRNKNFDLKKDILNSKNIIEKIINQKIMGFRAPQMQFSDELINILSELKFKYDSSIHAAYLPGFYNNKNVSLKPFKIGEIIEIPASASYSLRLPFSWAIMRIMPLFYTVKIIKKLLKKGITPVIYVHSWEFFEVKNKNVPIHITKNTGKKFCKKFERFLKVFKDEEFITMDELI